jgi:choline dehydrogenase-like flavoprotein
VGTGGPVEAPWIRRRDGVGIILQAAGVGGTTLHYNGISVRAYPSAIDASWPLTYEELVPFYERVEEFLPVRFVDDLATRFNPALLTHLMGTLRMGLDPASSVVDRNGEAHEVANLYVGDCSILPNGLGGPNPTLTAQALAVRTADAIHRRISS